MKQGEGNFEGIAIAAIEPDWNALGWNIVGLLAIIVWADVWSILMFGGLYMIKKLRIDRETEFKGNDLIKHGEAAYPRDAWVEMQYQMKNAPPKGSEQPEGDVPPHMQQQGTSNNKEEKAYNNAFEMMPAFGMLHKASSGFMSGVTLQAAQDLAKNKGQDNKAMDAIHESKE
jgi:hypothetical protein